MVHDKKQIPDHVKGLDFIIYGHSHIYEEKTKDGITRLNPGSCGPKRFQNPITMAVLELEDGNPVCRINNWEMDV